MQSDDDNHATNSAASDSASSRAASSTGADVQGIQVLSRAVDILRAVGNDSGELSLAKIALRVGLPRSTVQRIVNALLIEKMLVAEPNSSGYRIGSQIRQLAESARQDVSRSLQPLLKQLSLATGETVDLAVCRNEQMIFIDQVSGKQRLRAVSAIGESFPMGITANGKAVLSLMPDEVMLELCASERVQGTLAESAAKMKANLEQVRQLGFALDADEHTPGISAVGIAFNCSGLYYAISIPVPSSRFADNREQIIEALLNAGKEVCALLPDADFAGN